MAKKEKVVKVEAVTTEVVNTDLGETLVDNVEVVSTKKGKKSEEIVLKTVVDISNDIYASINDIDNLTEEYKNPSNKGLLNAIVSQLNEAIRLFKDVK